MQQDKKKTAAAAFSSFWAPCVIMLAVYAWFGMCPFGDKTVLIMDMSDQYVEFYAALRQIASGDASLLYSWGKSLGGNFMGIFAYYLSSPFSWLTLLFPAEYLTEALLFLNVLKIGCCGLTFWCLIRRMLKNCTAVLPVIFSVAYALMSYAWVYSMDLMWLDGLIWLPLILLGVQEIMERDRFLLFTASLGVLFISNYYISYMVGVFSFLFFLYLGLLNPQKQPARVFLKKFGLFMGGAVVALGCSAWLNLPNLFSLMAGKLDGAGSSLRFATEFSPMSLLGKFLVGGYDTITNGLPNVFCTTLAFLLAVGYFFNRCITKREKMLSGILLVILLLSFYLTPLNLAWHVFQEPNWFPFRNSFLFSFWVVYLACRCAAQWRGLGILGILVPPGTVALMIVVALLHGDAYVTGTQVFWTLFFVLLYGGVLSLIYFSKRNIRWKRAGVLVLALLVAVETAVNGGMMVTALDREFSYKTRTSYTGFQAILKQAVEEIEKQDDSFYRMEKDFERSKNDAIGLGYRGITHYSSDYNQSVNRLIRRLGMAQFHFWSGYYGSTPVTDSLLSIKYVMTAQKRLPEAYSLKNGTDQLCVYENPYALPIGFMVSEEIVNWGLEGQTDFELQNEFMSLATEEAEKCFLPQEPSLNKLENLRLEEETYRKEETGKPAALEYTVQVQTDGVLYGYLPGRNNQEARVYINGDRVAVCRNNESYCVFYAGEFSKGDKVTVRLELLQDSFSAQLPRFSVLQSGVLRRQTELLRTGAWDLTQFSNTMLQGTVTAQKGQALFTSIPYEEGWSITIDGRKAEPFQVADCLLAVAVPEGTHEIILWYSPKGFIPGLWISGISLLLFAGLCVLAVLRKRQENRGKNQG